MEGRENIYLFLKVTMVSNWRKDSRGKGSTEAEVEVGKYVRKLLQFSRQEVTVGQITL